MQRMKEFLRNAVGSLNESLNEEKHSSIDLEKGKKIAAENLVKKIKDQNVAFEIRESLEPELLKSLKEYLTVTVYLPKRNLLEDLAIAEKLYTHMIEESKKEALEECLIYVNGKLAPYLETDAKNQRTANFFSSCIGLMLGETVSHLASASSSFRLVMNMTGVLVGNIVFGDMMLKKLQFGEGAQGNIKSDILIFKKLLQMCLAGSNILTSEDRGEIVKRFKVAMQVARQAYLDNPNIDRAVFAKDVQQKLEFTFADLATGFSQRKSL